ncbi:metallophosphoesterase [Fulvivirga maritima]|uniref:metallophosphoesterase n=1 Tax=Fulvivirga maritima TaxID=2904247 RepID=UPI001F38A204|nr:metallophosphoesterase [Fulvivirga maritima]UII26724.1 metallophosphoesterase [Fulvivirga maritima]
MKRRIFRYLKHVGLTFLLVLAILIPVGIYHGAQLSYGHNNARINLNGEGPYVFYQSDSVLQAYYIRGNKDEGFYLDTTQYQHNEPIPAQVFFPLDSTYFNFTINAEFTSPEIVYSDDQQIIAISDIESGFKAFRDFLMHNKVIDEDLNWIFGKNHLVLNGDFVDRGFSTTQVLWFIYKLEQQANAQGGTVHFILGNHELKNMYGDYQASALKYTFVASILGETQADLLGKKSVLGRWLASKNVMELINGNLFVHGGLHPDLTDMNLGIEQINRYLRSTYYTAPYPKVKSDDREMLISSAKGICWYRGYFKEELEQADVEPLLNTFNAERIIVGHTLQHKVKSFYEGKVIGIDVKHAKDYHKNWPQFGSEGLLIKDGTCFRLLEDGEQVDL